MKLKLPLIQAVVLRSKRQNRYFDKNIEKHIKTFAK